MPSLHTSSSMRNKRAPVLLITFIAFTVYFIYIITNTPTVNKLNHDIIPAQNRSPEHEICKTEQVKRNIDPNHTNAHLRFWNHLSEVTVEVYKKKWQDFMNKIKSTRPPSWDKRGIVLVAGNKDTFQRTLTAIQILRKMHACQLDIEVWHLSDEQPSEEMKMKLESLGAKPKDLSDPKLVRPITLRRNAEKQFQIKAAAILNSSFKEVLYLDSDNLPAKDPTFLFDTPEYKSTGALFWPDFWKTHGENKVFDVLGIHCEDEWEQESGQMVIDKEKSWLPLQLAWYMQKHYDVYFQFLNGDKDTFKYAWKALNKPYHMSEVFVGMAGDMLGERFCGHTMLQYFPTPGEEEDDELLFVHANLLKITDKIHFIRDDGQEHPWDLAKHSSMSHSNTWIKPEFYIGPGGRACMDFTHREGEPEAVTENFDDVVPNLQSNYFKYGGIGGETRV